MIPDSHRHLTFRFPLVAMTALLVAVWPVPARAEDPVVRLVPYTVRAADATIAVRFVLSGTRLFDPQNDPILEARVVRVHATEADAATTLLPEDVLLAINNQELAGRTLREIATIVASARREPRQLWRVRRGLGTVLIQHNGAWTPPLPGLDR